MTRYLLYVPVVLLSYAIGSFNMAWFIGRLKGVDVARNGSGNLGASNAVVTMGWLPGVITALNDILKAFLCVLVARFLLGELLHDADVIAGASAILGHIFPFYLKFRGGKGLACLLGTALGIDWRFFLAAAAIIVIVTLATDYIALSTVLLALAAPVALALTIKSPTATVVFVLVAAVMVWKHRINLRRILDGTEIGLRRVNRLREDDQIK